METINTELKDTYITQMYKVMELINGIPQFTDKTKNISFYSEGEAANWIKIWLKENRDFNTIFLLIPSYSLCIEYTGTRELEHKEMKKRLTEKYAITT